MKKYIAIAALLAAGSAFANASESVVFTHQGTYNFNSTVHGFYFSLSGMTAQETYNATQSFTLDSLSVTGGANLGVGVTYGFLVLNESGNEVIGYSNQTRTSENGNALYSFTFSSISGSSLEIEYASTYRFLTVNASVLDAVANVEALTVSYGPGTDTMSSSVVNGVCNISGGLVAPGFRGYASDDADDIPYTIITGANGVNYTGNVVQGKGTYYMGNVATSVSASPIPEPSTFGLLAGLGALALVGTRRRRR